jgi:DNA binding domain, excisionase family protein
MTENTILCGNDVISCGTPEYRGLIETLRNTMQITDKIIAGVRPCLLNERYFTTEQVMEHFQISRSALQNYRDKGIIPYTSIGGVILYAETKILEIMENNFYNPIKTTY